MMKKFDLVLILNLIYLGIFTSCGNQFSEIDVEVFGDKSSTELNTQNQITLSNFEVYDINHAGFSASVNFIGDENLNANSVLYYCNDTLNPGCVPEIVGSNISLVKSSNQSSIIISGLTAPNYIVGNTINLKIITTDPDGVNLGASFSTSIILGTLKKIYRSVGPSNTSPLVSGAGNDLTITNSIASFAIALPNNIGVGDALQYDSDNNGSVDSVVFISGRTDSQNYLVNLADGTEVSELSIADQDWEIYRAYTSLSSAEDGIENTGLNDTIENFDSWSGGRNLTLNGEQWNITLYADADDTTGVTIDDWVTTGTYNLKIYTPYLSTEVGVSQRHNGKWASPGYTNTEILRICDANLSIEGIKSIIDNSNIQISNVSDCLNDSGYITLKDNLINGEADAGFSRGGIVLLPTAQTGITINIINNIIFNFTGAGNSSYGVYLRGSSGAPNIYVYNNTIYNTGRAFNCSEPAILKNNLAALSSGGSYSTCGGSSTGENNLSTDGTSMGTSPVVSASIDFINPTDGDFRLAASDTDAIGAGINLSSDIFFALTSDITGSPRVTWDIGAYNSTDFSGLTEFNAIGDGSSGFPYEIFTKAQLEDLANDIVDGCNSSTNAGCGHFFEINNNIDLTTTSFTPIGDITNVFTGTFDCNQNTISNLNLGTGSENYLGLFSYSSGATLSDCTLDSFVIDGADYLGALVADATDTDITNITVTNLLMNGNFRLGGIVGLYSGSLSDFDGSSSQGVINATGREIGGLIGSINIINSLTNSNSSISVSGDGEVGGIVGYLDFPTLFQNNFATGNVNCVTAGTESNCGGLIGAAYRLGLDACYASGNVIGDKSNLGGLIGRLTGGVFLNIDNSYALGDITGGSSSDNVGGFVGFSNAVNNTFQNNWSGGNIKSGGDNTGGFVGQTISDILDSFSLGRVYGDGNSVGGFVGFNSGSTLITRSFSVSDVYSDLGGQNFGGFVGLNEGSISRSYATGNVFAQKQYVGGFAGYNYQSTANISYSYSTGNVEGYLDTGGFLGGANITSGTVEFCYAKGNARGWNYIGGFVGLINGGDFENNYSLGDTTSSGTDAGGFAGVINSGTVSNNYNFGNVFGVLNSNAFIGNFAGGTLAYNYWNSDNTSEVNGTEGVASVVGQYEPLTTSQFMDDANFDSGQSGFWDYTTNWTQQSGRGYPIHKNTPEGICIDNPIETTYNALGNGNIDNPFVLCNANQINNINNNGCGSVAGDCDKHYILGSDIYMNNSAILAMASTNQPLLGSFDGRGHTIYSFKGDRPFIDAVGVGGHIRNFNLFDYVNDDGGIQTSLLLNLADNGSFVLNNKAVGYLPNPGGRSGGIAAVSSTDSILYKDTFIGKLENGGNKIGGLVGNGGGSKIILGRSYASIAGVSRDVGGIVGDNGSIFRSKSFGAVTAATERAGGVSGNGSRDIIESFSSADVTAGTGIAGGVVGYTGSSPYIVKDSYALNSVIEGFGNVSTNGVVGQSFDPVINTYAVTTFPSGGSGVGNGSPHIENFWDTTISGILDGDGTGSGSVANQYEGKTTAEMLQATTYSNWDTINVWLIADTIRTPMLRWDVHPICQSNVTAVAYNDIGLGTIEDPYLICFKEQLLDISNNGCDSDSSAGCNSHYLLMNDIDLKGSTFNAIGDNTNNFTGSFDGNNFIISNMYHNNPPDYFGFVGQGSNTAVLKNINITLADIISAGINAGLLAGVFDGLITNCHVQGSLDGWDAAGGLVGRLTANSRLEDSSAYVEINMVGPNNPVGGLVGTQTAGSTIRRSFAAGSITANSDEVGGFVGVINGEVLDSRSSMDVFSTDQAVGGFVGRNNGIIRRSSSLGNVESGDRRVGGFVGEAGGTSLIEDSYSIGNVTGVNAPIGGFIGRTVSATTPTIQRCYSRAVTITAPSSHPFIGGFSGGTLTNNYWDNTLIAGTDNIGSWEGLATVNMDNSANFSGWDTTTIWHFPASSYPEIIPLID